MRKLLILSLLIVLLIFSIVMAADIFSTSEPIAPKDYQKLLGSGIDVNWVIFSKYMSIYKSCHDKNLSLPLLFKQRGFTNLRIRVADVPLNSVQKDGLTLMQQLKMVVNDCIKAKIFPIITFGATEFRKNPNSTTLKRSLTFWKDVATEFKSYPYAISYDLIIETSGNISKHGDLLNEFYQKAILEIRNIDKYRIIFITPNDTSNPYSLPKLWYPKNDKYTMIEWHFYASGPSKRNKTKLWTTGTDYEKNLILKKIKFAKNWCEKNGMYCYNGAWMPTNFNHAKHPFKMTDCAPMGDYSLDQEINFAKFVSSSLKANNIPFSINAGSKFFNYDNLKWYSSVSSVLNAILN